MLQWASGSANTNHEVGSGCGKFGGGEKRVGAGGVGNERFEDFEDGVWEMLSLDDGTGLLKGGLVDLSYGLMETMGRDMRNQSQVSVMRVSAPVLGSVAVVGL